MQESIQKNLETTLAEYVAMPTITDDIPACTVAIKDVAAHFEQCGMVVNANYSSHPYLISTTTKAAMHQKHVKILLVAHLDVVPASGKAGFELQVAEDKLYGRGVYDMKFAAACYAELIEQYAKANNLDTYDIGILITTDEEKGEDTVRQLLNKGWSCGIAIIPDGGGNWRIESRAKGIKCLSLQANGRSAHSSRPWLAVNPMAQLAPALNHIMQEFKNDDPQNVTVSINSIIVSNGTQLLTTQIPEWVKAGLDIRAFTIEEMNAAYRSIQHIADEHKLVLTTILDGAPARFAPEDSLAQNFMQVLKEVHGSLEFSETYGCSDARFFAERHIPTVVMYPEGGDHHGANEWIKRQDLYKYYNLLHTFIQKAAIRP